MIRFASASLGALLVVGALFAQPVRAQDALSVTVTPPLFQLSIGPGEEWSSVVKVVNNNDYDVTYVAQTVDFRARGELGQSEFIPLVEQFADDPLEAATLAHWIEITSPEITISAGRSADIPFTVRIPMNAPPGGHYAAIMIGPKGEETVSGSYMRVSSFVTSLLFVRIKGDINEEGRIREFTVGRTLYQKPEVDFTVRFENMGNTHLRPQGTIEIFNMWGKKRGELFVNERSGFGNVLPETVRRFEFTWLGEENVFDIGRYSAAVTLTFGEESKRNLSANTYFWVVPLLPVGVVLSIVVATGLLLMWFIRRYIRRALSLEKSRLGLSEDAPLPVSATPTIRTFVRPITEGVVDLRRVGAPRPVSAESPSPLTLGGFMRTYRLFFAFVGSLIVLTIGASLFLGAVLVPERAYEISGVSGTAEAGE